MKQYNPIMIKAHYIMLFIAFAACQYTYSQQADSVIDTDGNIYKTISIGKQIWMAENLRTTSFSDSTPIAFIAKKEDWGNLTTAAYMWYDNNKEHSNTYGAFYNWYAVNTEKLCPKGWHIPSDKEWNELEILFGLTENEIEYISYRATRGGDLKATGTVQDSNGLWHTPNEGASNMSGFTALPGGFSYYADGVSYGIGSYGFWWSASEQSDVNAWYRMLYFHSFFMSRGHYPKNYGFSVRCIKNLKKQVLRHALGCKHLPKHLSRGKLYHLLAIAKVALLNYTNY